MAKSGSELPDSVLEGEQISTQNQENQTQLDDSSLEPVIYFLNGASISDQNEEKSYSVVQIKETNQKNLNAKKVKKNINLSAKLPKSKKRAKKYPIKEAKIFYSIPDSEEEFISKSSLPSSVFIPTYDCFFKPGDDAYYFLQNKEYDKIFISYQSERSSLQFYNSYSVRPPPILCVFII